jgi:hypothetical protein
MSVCQFLTLSIGPHEMGTAVSVRSSTFRLFRHAESVNSKHPLYQGCEV